MRKMKYIPTNITVEAYTSPSPISGNLKSSFAWLRQTMNEHGFRHIPITQNEKLVGIISERDLRLCEQFADHSDYKAEDIMVEHPETVLESTSLVDAAFILSEKKIGSLLVVNKKDELIGIFTVTDALNALIEVLRGEVEL